MSHVVDLAGAEALGGKAGALARLIAAGLPVPPGLVVAGGEIGDEVLARARALGPRLAVRSSVSIEDRAAGSAAGVFVSRVAVPPEELASAVEEVRASARTPLAGVFAQRAGVASLQVAVVIQRFVAGARVTVYTRPPGRPDADEVWIEREGAPVEKVRRDDPRARLALAAEAAIGATAGADVELVDGDATWIVQARPIVHPAPAPRRAPPPPILLAFSTATPGVTWTLDVAHNPDPLSSAQAGLVDLVERAGAAPWRMRVVGGYLYTAPGDAPDDDPIDDVATLIARWRDQAARMESVLATPARHLAEAIAAYVAFYRIYAREVTPMLGAARRRLVERVGAARAAKLVARRTGSIEEAIASCARGAITEDALLAIVRDQSPAWDVAVPTYGERFDLVRAAIERMKIAPPSTIASEAPPDDLRSIVAVARAAAGLAEEDDRLFARAQAQVRRALLDLGARLGIGEDVWWVPLGEVMLLEAESLEQQASGLRPQASGSEADRDSIDALRARAGAARSAWERAKRWQMPLAIRDGAALSSATDDWRGVGSGGVVSGVVHRIDSLTEAALVPSGAIAVVPAVTPALAVVLAGARGLISASGGILDHGAAIARELGIPCVVGVAASAALTDGDLVEIDGDAGTIRRLA